MRKVWNEYPVSTLARSYVHHAQVASAILKDHGRDDFVKENKSLHCGVRKIVQPYFENDGDGLPSGVTIMSSLQPADINKILCYPAWPDVDELDHPKKSLTLAELTFLTSNVPYYHPLYYKFAENEVTYNDDSEDDRND